MGNAATGIGARQGDLLISLIQRRCNLRLMAHG